MKVKDIIKKQTTVIAIAVVLVVVATIGISYSVFFAVDKNSDNQVITAGTLKVTLNSISALTLDNPMNDETGKSSEDNVISYTVKNDNTETKASNLPAKYSLYIYADSDNTIELSKIKIFIEEDDKYSEPKVLNSISDTIQTDANAENVKGQNKIAYKIDEGTLEVGKSSNTKKLHVWVDEDALGDEVNGQKVSLNLYVVSEVDETSNP